MTQLRLIPIHHSESAPPLGVPPGHVGWVYLPGTGRLAWWTGRVAIGARYQPPQHHPVGEGMQRLQVALLHAA
jgi:hypothetical protein